MSRTPATPHDSESSPAHPARTTTQYVPPEPDAPAGVPIQPLSRLTRRGYAVGAAAFSLPHQAVASFALFYATAVLRLPATAVGGVIAMTILWDAVTDPLMGHVSDRTRSPLGRRHPYLALGAVSVAILSLLFWTIDPETSTTSKLVWLTVLLLGLKTALTIYVIPYNALGAELSHEYRERAAIQGARATWYLIGMVVAVAGAMAVFFRSSPAYPRGQLDPSAYPRMALTIAVVTLLAAAVSYGITRREIPRLTPPATPRRVAAPWTAMLAPLRNGDFRALGGMIFIAEAGFQLGIAISLHTNTYTYRLTGPQMALLAMVLFATSIASQPLWTWASTRFDRRKVLTVGGVLLVFGFVGAPWTHVWWGLFPIDSPSLPLTLAMFHAIAGLGNGAFMSVPFAMVADVADAEAVETGRRSEAVYFGQYTFAYKLGTAVALVLTGVTLDLIGFNAAASLQSEAVQFRLGMVPTYYLLAAFPLAIFSLWKFRLSRARVEEIQSRLRSTA